MRAFWPVGEAAQVDYEQLRAAVLSGVPLIGPAAARFAAGGLAALIAAPSAPAAFSAVVISAERPPWTPHNDPRLAALAEGYALVLVAGDDDKNSGDIITEEVRR